MKYDDFAQLCDREWAAGPPFGDVTALSLTDASGKELLDDPHITEADGLTIRVPTVGAAPDLVILNPVTRSEVAIRGGAEADTATVSYGNFDWSPPPRTVTIG